MPDELAQGSWDDFLNKKAQLDTFIEVHAVQQNLKIQYLDTRVY